SALDPPVADPAAAPDQRPVLVVAAPDVPRVGGRDRVPARTAEQPAEYRRAVPARRAQPRDRPVGPDERAALPVRDQRVLPQHPRGRRASYTFACFSCAHDVPYFLVWSSAIPLVRPAGADVCLVAEHEPVLT